MWGPASSSFSMACQRACYTSQLPTRVLPASCPATTPDSQLTSQPHGSREQALKGLRLRTVSLTAYRVCGQLGRPRTVSLSPGLVRMPGHLGLVRPRTASFGFGCDRVPRRTRLWTASLPPRQWNSSSCSALLRSLVGCIGLDRKVRRTASLLAKSAHELRC